MLTSEQFCKKERCDVPFQNTLCIKGNLILVLDHILYNYRHT